MEGTAYERAADTDACELAYVEATSFERRWTQSAHRTSGHASLFESRAMTSSSSMLRSSIPTEAAPDPATPAQLVSTVGT